MTGYGRTNALKSYGRVANVESSPVRGIVMLYDGAIKFLKLAAADMDVHDAVAKAEHTDRALDIVIYLQSILDFEAGGEVARTYDRLYASVTATVLRASARFDSNLMREAAELLVPVRDAWAANAATVSDVPLAIPVAATPVVLEAR